MCPQHAEYARLDIGEVRAIEEQRAVECEFIPNPVDARAGIILSPATSCHLAAIGLSSALLSTSIRREACMGSMFAPYSPGQLGH